MKSVEGKIALPRVVFTAALQRHTDCPDAVVSGNTVWQALEAVFEARPKLRGYVVDEQNRLRKHMVIFVDGQRIQDREQLSDAVEPNGEVYVMQALSGG